MQVGSPRTRGMAAGGCVLVMIGMAVLALILAGISGYFFYQNFGKELWLVRDDMQPVGERFIHLLDEETYQSAYGLLSERAKEEWPPEKFGPWAIELRKKLGRLQEFSVLAQPTVDYVTQNRNGDLNDVPMFFPCKYTDGGQSFVLTFHFADGEWLIDKIKLTEIGKEISLVPEEQRSSIPNGKPIPPKAKDPASTP